MDKMAMETKNKTLERLEQLKALLPEVITETKDANGDIVSAIDAKKLEQLLSTKVIEGDESYDFTWVGKKQAMVEASRPIRKTLRPCKEESVDWDKTENLYIEGDNLDVLKLLQESYLNKIKMIYIDPPYNTGNDSFIYPDDYKTNKEQYDEEVGAIDESGYRMFKNTETNGRFHSSWCSMMYPRLKLARNLLTDDGVIFISIDDNEVTNLRKICDDVFGEKSFVTTIHVELSATQGMKVKAAKSGNIVKNAEYILVYSKQGHKNIATTLLYDYRPKYDEHYSKYLSEDNHLLNLKDVFSKKYPHIKIENLSKLYDNCEEFKNFVNTNTDKILADDKITGFDITHYPEIGKVYPVSKDDNSYLLYNNGNKLRQLLVLSDSFGQCDDFENSFGLRKIRGDWWKDFYRDMGNVSKEGEVVFANGKKPLRLIKQIVKMCTSQTDIILDFFSGSATTAHAVMQLNAEDGGKRKFIMVQLPEVCDEKSEAYKAGYTNICEIGKERIRRAGKKIKEETGKQDLDIGFRVLKLDESNMKDVYYAPADYNQSMLDKMTSNIKEDRTPEDLLYACMLEWGLELSLPHETKAINDYNIHIVNEGDLIACFDDKVSEDVIKQIADMEPLRVVFRDSSFATDSARINVDEIFKLKSPNTKIKVL